MTIKVTIIKTADGYNFRNAESGKLIGTIHEARIKQNIYTWETFGEHGLDRLAKCINFIKLELLIRAERLGCDIEFINL